MTDAATTGDHGPLVGRRVLVARAAHQQDALSRRLRALGADPVEVPLLAIEPPQDGGADLRRAAQDLAAGRYTAVGITSANGAAALADALDGSSPDAMAALSDLLVACVGPGTARRTRSALGREPDLVAPVHTTTGLGRAFPAGPGRVLLPRADIASPELPAALADKGWQVDDVHAYRTRLVTTLPGPVLDDLLDGGIDAVAAGSPSTIDALVAALDGRTPGAALVSIGPVTSARARHHGLDVAAEADPHDLPGLVAACVAALATG